MSESSRKRARDFLRIADQFQLGELTTESSHPVTASLSEVAARDTEAALELLFAVDRDVTAKYREWAKSGQSEEIVRAVISSLRGGGRMFFTGCGATGRLSILLDSTWRDFWQRMRAQGFEAADDWEKRAVSVMAGGDFALIKSVEGFEDYTEFGARQIEDACVRAGDVVFAITEGGETSFVIGTAWKALETGAKVYFVYNNPDDILRAHVRRSREIIDEPRIEKINLTTGPMAITGSTRMQATSIQLCVLVTILEMVARELTGKRDSASVPHEFAASLEEMHAELSFVRVRRALAMLVELEESVYRSGGKINYFADALAIDVLTDTTERSPTFCTPPFRKWGDKDAADSWAFLFTAREITSEAWERLLKRPPRAVEWTEAEIVRNISLAEILRFRIGLDGLDARRPCPGDAAVGVLVEPETSSLISTNSFIRAQLEAARVAEAKTGIIFFGSNHACGKVEQFVSYWDKDCICATVEVPDTDFLLDGVTRIGAKMLLNALSTCTMVRLGRVMGNYMTCVVPSNLKLIDRAARYISRLAGLPYKDACYRLFEVIEHVEPMMRADQAYPPVVELAVTSIDR